MKTNLLKLALCAVAMLSATYATAEDQPRATTTWLFNQFYQGTVQTITTTSEVKGLVYSYDRLYLCIGDGSASRTRTLTATAATAMPNATAPVVSEYTPFAKGDYVGLTFGTKSRTPTNTTADATSNYNLAAVRPKVAGKLYVLANTNTSGNNITIYEGNTSKASASRSTADWILVSCDVTADKRYFIGCQDEDSWTLYGVKFVPTTDQMSLAQHDISVNVTNGYATFSSACNYKVPTGYKAYTVSDVNATSATLTQIAHIPSNTGVILIGDEGNTEEITMTNLRESDITDADKTTAAANNLIGNVGGYDLPANNGSNYNYILTTEGFKHSSGSGTLAGNKAYLRTNVNVSSKTAIKFEFSEVTAVNDVVAAPQANKAELKKYFENGKLVIESNGVKYNVAGAQIK